MSSTAFCERLVREAGVALTPGAAFAGNFYKCDESLHPHFGAWSPIDAPAPDFHRPECFGKLVIEP